MARKASTALDHAPGPHAWTPREDHEPMNVWVTRQLRLAIQDGRLALGAPLSELRLAAALGVSRTPVREALSSLQQQGLIDIRPQSGSYVFTASAEGVRDLSDFRRIVESAALRMAVARRCAALLADLNEACVRMETAFEHDDPIAFSRADTAFHEAIVENSANQCLVSAYAQMSGRLAAIRTSNNLRGPASNRRQAMREHRALIQAIVQNDVQAAENLLDEHVGRMERIFKVMDQTARAEAVAAGAG